jgi:putative ABC transport system substrate-binding protein
LNRLQRRTFVIGAGAALAAARAAVAQERSSPPRIGYLALNTEPIGRNQLNAFRATLRELGWIAGQSIVIDTRFADGQVERLPALVGELLALDVDLIVATSSATARASKSATTTVPIVMLASANAVGEGLVVSLAHPGGNITGMTLLAGPEIASKQLELLHKVAPAAARIAFLMNPRNGSHAMFEAELARAARTLGVQLQAVGAGSPGQLEDAFAAMARQRVGALLVLSDAMFLGERRWILGRTQRAAMPAIYSQREFVDDGGLMSYGPSLLDMSRRGARQVDRILRGARPGDIPVEQPTKFELVVNLKVARALGLTVPQALLLSADDVLQ